MATGKRRGRRSSSERESLVCIAKLAQKAQRYEDMLDAIKTVAYLNFDLTKEEQHILSVAFKTLVDSKTTWWRNLLSTEQEAGGKGNKHKVNKVKEYRETVRLELCTLCEDIVKMIDEHLLPSCSELEAALFYHKMKGDCSICLTRIKVGGDAKVSKGENFVHEVTLKLDIIFKKNDIVALAAAFTEGSSGSSDLVLVGACVYIEMRKDGCPLSMDEIASAVGCPVHVLGQKIQDIIKLMGYSMANLPIFNLFFEFERKLRTCFEAVERSKMEIMEKQGKFVIEHIRKWDIYSRCKPMPILAAVIFLVAKVNEVAADLKTLAPQVCATFKTSLKNYGILCQKLAEIGQELPHGRDINLIMLLSMHYLYFSS